MGRVWFFCDKIVALLKSLPKSIRKSFIPVPTYAQAILIDFEADRYKPLKSVIAKHIARIVGFVVDEQGKILAIDKDIHKLKQKLKDLVQLPQRIVEDKVYNDWQFLALLSILVK